MRSYIASNWYWLLPLVISLICTLLTGLSNWKREEGWRGILRIIVEMFSVAQNYNSKGSLKAPLTRCNPPVEADKGGTP